MIPGGVVRRARTARRFTPSGSIAIFEDVDVLLTPVVGISPPETGRWAGKGALRTLMSISRAYPCAIAWNYTGQPAASIPLPAAARRGRCRSPAS